MGLFSFCVLVELVEFAICEDMGWVSVIHNVIGKIGGGIGA